MLNSYNIKLTRHTDYARLAVLRGSDQRRAALLVCHLGIGAVLKEKLRALYVAVQCRYMQWRALLLVFQMNYLISECGEKVFKASVGTGKTVRTS